MDLYNEIRDFMPESALKKKNLESGANKRVSAKEMRLKRVAKLNI